MSRSWAEIEVEKLLRRAGELEQRVSELEQQCAELLRRTRPLSQMPPAAEEVVLSVNDPRVEPEDRVRAQSDAALRLAAASTELAQRAATMAQATQVAIATRERRKSTGSLAAAERRCSYTNERGVRCDGTMQPVYDGVVCVATQCDRCHYRPKG